MTILNMFVLISFILPFTIIVVGCNPRGEAFGIHTPLAADLYHVKIPSNIEQKECLRLRSLLSKFFSITFHRLLFR